MKKIIVSLALLALAACSSVSTDWDYNPQVNFSEYKNYAWVDKKTSEDFYQLNGLMDQRVRTAIDKEMQQKGLTKVAEADADVLINYLTKIDKKMNIDTFYNNYGYRPYGGRHGGGWAGGVGHSQTVVNEYQVGTFIVDLVDAKTKKLVWRGTGADIIRDNITPDERIENVNTVINSVMENFPPKADK